MRDRLMLAAVFFMLAGTHPLAAAGQDLSFQEMRWRDIDPTRAGRARALAGVPDHRTSFYAGFDNGGVWRSTNDGANWVPLFEWRLATASTNPPTKDARGSGSDCATVR